MIHYFWWVPCIILISVFYSWCSVVVNRNPSSLWFWVLCIQFPLWAFVSRISKNIAFDGIVYDALLCLSYAVALLWFSGAPGFKLINYIGVAFIICGTILMKV